MRIKKILLPALFALAAAGNVFPEAVTAGSALIRLQGGINLYTQEQWEDALKELRWVAAESPSKAQRVEALYWISLTELSSGDYERALHDMEALEALNPSGKRAQETLYHKGRVLYYLERYEEAIVFLTSYTNSMPDADGDGLEKNASAESWRTSNKAAAFYWIGECLYSLGHMDKALEIFLFVTENYPGSYKYEAASYKISLINQKKVENELLGLLKWTHEESLKTMEEYSRREEAYDQALTAYQKRISEMLKDTRLSDLESENSRFRQQLFSAEDRIRSLENELEAALLTGPVRSSGEPDRNTDADEERKKEMALRLQTMRSSAEELRNEIEKSRGGGTASPPER